MHPSLEKAYALLSGRAAKEAEEEAWRTEHADAIVDAELDMPAKAATPTIKQRDYGDVIRKRRDDALVVEPQPQVTMSEQDSEGWNRWFDERLQLHLDIVLKVIAEEHGEKFHQLTEDVRALDRRLLKRLGEDHTQKLVLYDPSSAMAREIQKVVAPLRAEIALLQKQIWELKKA